MAALQSHNSAELHDSTLLTLFKAVPPSQRRKLPLVCKRWHRLCQSSELWTRVQVTLGAEFLRWVDVAAMYRWFLARSEVVEELEFAELSSPDCWAVVCGVLGIVGRQLGHLRIYGDGEGCYEPGGRAAWLALVPGLRSLEVENAADWMIGLAPHLPRSLTRLELGYCGEEGLPSVPQHLGGLPALASLSLQGSQLDNPGALEPLQHCCALQRLNLSDCCLREVPPCLAALSGSLTSLTLSCNPMLGGDGNELQIATLAALRNLRLLEMRDCGLTSVPASVTGLTSLRTLLLAMNCMTARPFMLPGPYLQHLALLGLSNCFADEEVETDDEEVGVTLDQLAAELEEAVGLEALRLNRNMGLRLHAAGLEALLRGKPHFRRLDFSREMADEAGMRPEELRARFPGVLFVYNYS